MDAFVAGNARTETAFLTRVAYFIVKAAIAITTEDAGIARHADRLALASKILGDTDTWSRAFAIPVLTNPTNFAKTGLADISDADLEFTVNSVYNSLI